jgi:hypothetical protein
MNIVVSKFKKKMQLAIFNDVNAISVNIARHSHVFLRKFLRTFSIENMLTAAFPSYTYWIDLLHRTLPHVSTRSSLAMWNTCTKAYHRLIR